MASPIKKMHKNNNLKLKIPLYHNKVACFKFLDTILYANKIENVALSALEINHYPWVWLNIHYFIIGSIVFVKALQITLVCAFSKWARNWTIPIIHNIY